jgi:hypothetical protein
VRSHGSPSPTREGESDRDHYVHAAPHYDLTLLRHCEREAAKYPMDKILSKERKLLRRYALPQQGGGALAGTSTQYVPTRCSFTGQRAELRMYRAAGEGGETRFEPLSISNWKACRETPWAALEPLFRSPNPNPVWFRYARGARAPHHELTPSERIGLHYTPLALYWSPIRMPASSPHERAAGVAAAAAAAAAAEAAAEAAAVLPVPNTPSATLAALASYQDKVRLD